MKKSSLIILLLIVCSFSLFTDNNNRFRKYLESDLPFNYKVHESTPANWIAAIQAGANVWNNIEASYFKFNYDGTTNESSDGRDGTNLVYFDLVGDNFDPETNIIAYSATYTEGYGTDNYRSVESDLVWNARDFPPAVNDDGINPLAQDLQSVVAHEFGHHMGLGHTGDAGSPPGVGELIEDATMYGFASSGDTTSRSLHIDDIMGAISIYPRWTVALGVSDTNGNGLDDYLILLDNTISALYDDPIFHGEVYQKAGYVAYDSIFARNVNGTFQLVSYSNSFNISIDKFGFLNFDTTIVFSDLIETPQTRQINIELVQSAQNDVTLIFLSQDGDTINSVFRFYAYSDITTDPFYQDTIFNKSSFNISLPTDNYDIEFEPAFPYAFNHIDNVLISSDSTLTVVLDIAEVLLVDDDFNENGDYSDRSNYYIRNVYNGLGKNLAYLDLKYGVNGLSDKNISQIRDIIWFMGDNPIPALALHLSRIDSLFSNGHNIIFSGNHFLSAIDDTDFLSKTLFIEYAGISPIQILQGFENEFIGQGETVFLAVDSLEEMIPLTVEGISPVFQYFNSDFGAVKYQGDYKFVLFSFALEDSLTDTKTSDYLKRSLQWFDIPTSIEEGQTNIVSKFELYNNYPNPFNPSTQIDFELGKETDVDLIIYNSLGQEVITLISSKKVSHGMHSFSWNGKNFRGQQVASGIYYCRLTSSNFVITKKMILLR